MNIMSFSDDDDLHLFESRHDPELAEMILRIKHNDSRVKKLLIHRVDDWDGVAWGRLGYILGQNIHVEELSIWYGNLDVAELCAGLQNNRCIQLLDFGRIDLQDIKKMRSLAPFLSNNSNLKKVRLIGCHLGPDGINILSIALSNRLHDTLETLNLDRNHSGDIDLDDLVLALSRSRNLTRLSLTDNGIGLRGCTSLAKLLRNQESNLDSLDLSHNYIDDDSVIILADSLVRNTKLRTVYLDGYNGITASGWSAFQKLVCNNPSISGVIESNHTLNRVGMWPTNYTRNHLCVSAADLEKTDVNGLGVNDANLLRASLKMNDKSNKTLTKRRKILWSHARGELNLGDSFIATGAMPRILAWIGNYSNETNASAMSRIQAWIRNESNQTNVDLIQYHDPPLAKARINAIRLDSIYRIIQSRPELCKADDTELLSGNNENIGLLDDAVKPIHARLWGIIYLMLLRLGLVLSSVGIVWPSL